jgi:hypothetical protein
MKRLLACLAATAFLATGTAFAQAAAGQPAGQEAAKPAKPAKTKTMSANGTVKSVSADSLVVTDKDGKDWTFAVDSATKVIARGGSHMEAAKKAAGEPVMITDAVKEGAKVSVKYHDMDGKMHAASVRVM